MAVQLYTFSRVAKAKSHLCSTHPAWREFRPCDCRNRMGEGVIVAVEPIVGRIVDAGDGHSISRLEFVFDLRRRSANRSPTGPLVRGELPRGYGYRAGGQGSVEE